MRLVIAVKPVIYMHRSHCSHNPFELMAQTPYMRLQLPKQSNGTCPRLSIPCPLPIILLHLPPRIQHHLLPPPLQRSLPLILIRTPRPRASLLHLSFPP